MTAEERERLAGMLEAVAAEIRREGWDRRASHSVLSRETVAYLDALGDAARAIRKWPVEAPDWRAALDEYRSAVAELRAWSAEVVAEGPAAAWIAVEERLPEPGSKYLLYSALSLGSAVGFLCSDGEFRDDEGRVLWVTHWRPLPPPPTTPGPGTGGNLAAGP